MRPQTAKSTKGGNPSITSPPIRGRSLRNYWLKKIAACGTASCTASAGGDGEIVTVALSQLGNVGGQPYWSWYGFNSRVEWCASFVSWCADQCRYLDTGVIPKFAGYVQGSRWFKECGLWQDRDYEPRPGDIIFFDWHAPGGFAGPQDGVPDHVGIVEKVENGTIYTVEGNSGDRCRENRYAVGTARFTDLGRRPTDPTAA